MWQDSHLSDAQLLMDLDGELSPRQSKKIGRHLAGCWQCRARRQALDQTIAEFTRVKQQTQVELPPAAGPRALLKARIEQLSSAELRQVRLRWNWTLAFAACAAIVVGVIVARHSTSRPVAAVPIPDARLTPGATLRATRESVCTEPNTKNRAVPVALRRKVFESYGLSNVSPRDYEVDYLITPALGGADDIHNLWPQPYGYTVWNAEVKDALEDRLREMVCDGSLDLTEAQQEIAVNWIAAYKKYFHTDRPLAEHDAQ